MPSIRVNQGRERISHPTAEIERLLLTASDGNPDADIRSLEHLL
jgi:hypothetical protein